MKNIVIQRYITLDSPLIIEGKNQTRHHKNTIFHATGKICEQLMQESMTANMYQISGMEE